MANNWKKKILCAFLPALGMCMVLFYSLDKKHVTAGKDVCVEREVQEEDVLGSCVRIQAKEHYGSGSILAMDENKITIVTNRHVLQYWDEDSYVTFFNGTVREGRVAGISGHADVGFLQISAAEFDPGELEGIRAVEIPDTGLNRGDWFFMGDLATDIWNPVFYKGQVLDPSKYLEEFGMEMVYGDSAFKEGMSGCGVFDVEGKYVGMLTGGTDQNEIAAVPACVVSALYEDIIKNPVQERG